MKRPEILIRILIPAAILMVIGAPLFIWMNTPLVHAKMAENGGWSPDVLQATVGEPLVLHLTSDDVTHGFAIAGMPMQSVDVLPGKVTDVTLNFDKPGTYTFYCTRWCGINHWKMRGAIEVTGASPGAPAVLTPPLYVSLGIDLNSPHNSPLLPLQRPSVDIGVNNPVPDSNSLPNHRLLSGTFALWDLAELAGKSLAFGSERPAPLEYGRLYLAIRHDT